MGAASIVIRPAVLGDVPAILEIYNEAVLNTTASYDYEPTTLAARIQWFAEHERDGYPMFVALNEGGRVVGWASLSRYHARPGYRFTTENSVYVAADQRGRGIGRLLLAESVEAAKRKGLHAIIAAIDADNQASLRLHEGFGFEKVGHFKRVGYKFDRWLDVAYLELQI